MPGRDAGLAVERTRLAWRRTVLAAGVVAVLTVRLALSGGTVGALVAALAGLGWLGVLLATLPRLAGRRNRSGRALAVTALVTAGFAGLGLLLLLAPVR
ncbi:DUF202 domain-containing protein [Micromonospora sp. WMMD1102]|uniref:DUF202 domain-containing protein n=1 Tax=Micromonospora sp. WMMD1102 TaxID=3016105 RepID=UPI0024154D1A|nr:DUF202 domain-containing protein [Micromonospora sp. WMMD1102]MDG4785414.1 DUF202 domain-containing protein [Micromonospora sp. WMMD1102]